MQSTDIGEGNGAWLLDGYGFIIDRHVDQATVDRAHLIAAGWDVDAHEVILAMGWVTAEDYTNSLAEQLSIASVFVSNGGADTVLRVDATAAPPEGVAEAVLAARVKANRVQLYSGLLPDVIETEADRRDNVEAAIGELRRIEPSASAGCPVPLWQQLVGISILGAPIGALIIDSRLAYFAVAFIAAVRFALVVLQRVAAFLTYLRFPRPRLAIPNTYVAMEDLPIYSVLVPLYQEAEILPDLIDALIRLDYPVAKLDVLLVLEDGDDATRLAADVVGRPGFIRVVSVPDAQPRTKPKALNYALGYARGDFIAVFDAEDIPEPRQLRDAVDVFRAHPDIDCLQGRLNLYNRHHSWLTRQFALEYTVLFDALLPSLERLHIPLPLGGASNHFRRAMLEQVNRWDPLNVTEDADLGMRLYRHRYRVGMLASTTWEEAPAAFAGWLPQRTRWIKGWMQTYLVHMRRPRQLWRDLGAWGFFGFQCLIGGFLLSALAYPFLYLVIAIELTRAPPFQPGPTLVEAILWHLAMFNLGIGYLTTMLFAVVAALRRRWFDLALHVPLMPIY